MLRGVGTEKKGKRRYGIYLTDLRRAFLSPSFLLAVAAGTAVCFLSLKSVNYERYPDKDAVYAWWLLNGTSISLLAHLTGLIPYSLCFYRDFCRGNYKNMLSRIGLKDYVLSKAFAAFLSSTAAFAGGKLLFVYLFVQKYPFLSGENTLLSISASYRLFYSFLVKGQYPAYFLAASLMQAMYCGILCLFVLGVSIVIPRPDVLYAVPIAVFYVANFYLRDRLHLSLLLDFHYIFDGETRLFSTDAAGVRYAAAVTAVMFLLLYAGMLRLVKKRVYG